MSPNLTYNRNEDDDEDDFDDEELIDAIDSGAAMLDELGKKCFAMSKELLLRQSRRLLRTIHLN